MCVTLLLANWRIANPRTKELIPLPCAGWKGKPLYRPKPEHDRSQEDQKPSFDAQKPAQEETELDVCKICYDREINCVFLYATALHSCTCVCCSFFVGDTDPAASFAAAASVAICARASVRFSHLLGPC